MVGEPALECLWTRNWNHDPPKCYPKDCGSLGELEHGVIKGQYKIYL